MIAETRIIKKIDDFFSRLFQSKKKKKEREASLLQKSYDLLNELEQKWSVSADERIDLVDYTNLLFQNAKEIKTRKNKATARNIRGFAQRNCLAGVIPDSEMERVRRETEELLEKMSLKDR
jgi:flagellar biosynthesis regulator FlaF